VKRFSKLERARAAATDAEARSTSTKRFEAIEAPRSAGRSADPFAPPPLADTPVQLELHDRYTEQVEDARHDREARATQGLAELEARVAARAAPHRAPGALDLVARGAGIGPLARLGTEVRLWIAGGVLLATWFAVALTWGGIAAVAVAGGLALLLLARGRTRT
jgi:hypothetical protein